MKSTRLVLAAISLPIALTSGCASLPGSPGDGAAFAERDRQSNAPRRVTYGESSIGTMQTSSSLLSGAAVDRSSPWSTDIRGMGGQRLELGR